MFRSVRLYRVNGPWPESEQQVSDDLSAAAFTPCGPLTETSSGWESPVGDSATALARRVGGADLLRLRTQLRVLPPAAIDEALQTRLDAYRARANQEPGRRAKRQLKEQTRDELLPKALLKSERIKGFCLLNEGIVGIDTGSESRAERFIEHLRGPLADLTLKPLAFARPIGALLKQILVGNPPPDFSLGTECRLQDPADRRATVRFVDMDLSSSAVHRCLKDGMELTHLGIGYANVMSCVIDAHGIIGKLRFTGLDERDTDLGDDPLAQFDAQSVLLTGTIRQLVHSLNGLLGVEE